MGWRRPFAIWTMALFSFRIDLCVASELRVVTWTTDAQCVEDRCRLQNSATLRALTNSCPRDLCSQPMLIKSNYDALERAHLAIALLQYEESTLLQLHKAFKGTVDTFVFDSRENQNELGNVLVYAKGKRLTEEPVNILQGLKSGSIGGIRNVIYGPKEESLDHERTGSTKRCIRELRRQMREYSEQDLSEVLTWLQNCALDDAMSDDDFEENRLELWSKVHQLGAIKGEDMSTSPSAYAERIWTSFVVPSPVDVWLSVSWVPVFDNFHKGLGHGDRYEALLMEVLQVEPYTPDIPSTLPMISTRGGAHANVKSRRFFALVACDDDDLESVLSCLQRVIPNVFLFQQIVWGMGFVGDYRNYHELELDWNGDPVYVSHGELPPKYEDIAQTRKSKNQRTSNESDKHPSQNVGVVDSETDRLSPRASAS